MGNVVHKIDEVYSLSVYQDDDGRMECVPVTEDGLVGEPVFFDDFGELIELYDSAMAHDFKIWTHQYEFEFEVSSNDN